MDIERILVPTDFSEHAENAYATAIELAKDFGARIELIHVYDIPNLSMAYEIAFPDHLTEGVRAAATQKLRSWEERATDEGIAVSSRLVFGIPERVIAEHAEVSKIDLIVMSTRGLSAIKHVLLGSVAERTLRAAPCPVLTIGARSIGAKASDA